MEKETFIASSGNFYYDGSPSISGSFSSGKKFTNLDTEAIIGGDTSNTNAEINARIGLTITITQIIFVFFCFFFVIKGISNWVKNRKKVNNTNNEVISSYEEKDYLNADENERKRPVFRYFILGGFLYFMLYIIGIIF